MGTDNATSAVQHDLVAVVLAAGTSSRFGEERFKQLVEIDGEPLVRRTCQIVLDSSIGRIVVVVGHRANEVRDTLQGLNLEIAHNPDYAQGQSTSVRRGLEQCSEAQGVLFVPCDQPFLETSLIDRLVDAWRQLAHGRHLRIVLPCFEGRRGAPVLFGSSFFGELDLLEGDTGGRAVLAQHKAEIVEVGIESEAPLLDVDTDDDLRRLMR